MALLAAPTVRLGAGAVCLPPPPGEGRGQGAERGWVRGGGGGRGQGCTRTNRCTRKGDVGAVGERPGLLERDCSPGPGSETPGLGRSSLHCWEQLGAGLPGVPAGRGCGLCLPPQLAV